MAQGDYDLAGFAVGAVERDKILPRKDIAAGDIVLGVASSGVHSNGFSLVRKLVAQEKLSYTAPAPFDSSRTLADALLEPTRIYVKPVLKAIKTGDVKALAHITGGGLLENIPRVLPEGFGALLDAKSWQAPPVFAWMAKVGNIEPQEMARTFNCGIGLVLIVAKDKAANVSKILSDAGEKVFAIGEIEVNATAHRVTLKNTDKVWPC